MSGHRLASEWLARVLHIVAIALLSITSVLAVQQTAFTDESATRYGYDEGTAPSTSDDHQVRIHHADQRILGGGATSSASAHGYDDLSDLARAYSRPSGYRLAPNTARAGAGSLDELAGAVCSFSAVTAVVMADGSLKAIADVEVGDYVLAEDPETGERGPRRVTHLWEHDDTLVDLEVDGDLVTTTEDHPFWNATDREWQQARDLGAGDLVRTADGEVIAVDGLVVGSSQWGAAYNLTVDGLHTFFVVVGEDEVLVHNTCPSASNYRQNFTNANPSMPSGHAVHHALPQRYESIMQRVGVNIHENQFLRGVDPTIHSQITTAWGRWHRGLGGRMPTAQEITNFSYRIDEQFGQHFIGL